MARIQKYRAADRRAAKLKWLNVPPGMPTDLADEFMQRLMAGSTLRRLTSGVEQYGPALVSKQRFKKHCELHPKWAAEALRMAEANAKAADYLKGHRRNQTHCKFGHPLSGSNIRIEEGRFRRCLTCQRRQEKNPPLAPIEKQIEQVTAALNSGSSLSLICTGKVAGKRIQAPIFSYRKLRFYRGLNPEFHRFVISSTVRSNSKGQQRRYNPERARVQAIRTEANDYYNILGMIPAGLPDDVGDDVAQSIMLALLEGSLRRDQVQVRIQQFVRDHNRMFPTKFAKFGDSPLVSLDEVLFDGGTATRADVVCRGLWD